MEDYRAVRSTLDMSKRIAFYLEMSDPAGYPAEHRAKTVGYVNNVLQGRAERPPEDLLAELEEKGGEYYAKEIAAVRQDFQQFQVQKSLLSIPYVKSSSKQYKFRTYNAYPDRPLKIINQQLFDWAAKAGFPPGFFRESYFDRVTLYCVPQGTDFNFSMFQNCAFAVCRIENATFDGTSIYSSEFHSAEIDHTTFFNATIANTHFYDSSLKWVSFQGARLKSSNTLDCVLDNVSFLRTTLDGCSYGRVTPSHIQSLETANITMGGATDDECRRNRAAIFKALQVKDIQIVPKDVLNSRKKRSGQARQR